MRYPSSGGKGSDPRFIFSEEGRQNFDDIFRKSSKSKNNKSDVTTETKTETVETCIK